MSNLTYPKAFYDMEAGVMRTIAPVAPRTVEIDADELARLRAKAHFLECLEAAGLDNWEGVSEAHEIYREEGGTEDV